MQLPRLLLRCESTGTPYSCWPPSCGRHPRWSSWQLPGQIRHPLSSSVIPCLASPPSTIREAEEKSPPPPLPLPSLSKKCPIFPRPPQEKTKTKMSNHVYVWNASKLFKKQNKSCSQDMHHCTCRRKHKIKVTCKIFHVKLLSIFVFLGFCNLYIYRRVII